MRIAMFGHKKTPSREGGVEIVVEELARRMAAQGHDVTCYNRRDSRAIQENYCGVRCIYMLMFLQKPELPEEILYPTDFSDLNDRV